MKFLLALMVTGTVSAAAAEPLSVDARIAAAASTVREMRRDRSVPGEWWNRAQCVLVIPALQKRAFIVGGEYGEGLMSCRATPGPGGGREWSPPVFMEIGRGSMGLQIGAQTIDLILLVMNAAGKDKVLGNQVSLGAEVSVAAGPVGRDAQAATDAELTAEILSYSRAQGLFAGINVSGGIIRAADRDNETLYDARVSPRDVVTGAWKPPAATMPFLLALTTGASTPAFIGSDKSRPSAPKTR